MACIAQFVTDGGASIHSGIFFESHSTQLRPFTLIHINKFKLIINKVKFKNVKYTNFVLIENGYE